MDLTTSRDIELLTDVPPAIGELREVATNLYWARLPLPMRLNHVNLWFMREGDALREGDAWLVVDAGLDAPSCRDAWEKLIDGPRLGFRCAGSSSPMAIPTMSDLPAGSPSVSIPRSTRHARNGCSPIGGASGRAAPSAKACSASSCRMG